jgi:hypothetical protein
MIEKHQLVQLLNPKCIREKSKTIQILYINYIKKSTTLLFFKIIFEPFKRSFKKNLNHMAIEFINSQKFIMYNVTLFCLRSEFLLNIQVITDNPDKIIK